ncbi:lantibiotic immunity ABC transporter MutE/EpiE family permease subunit [Clostridium sp. BJN0013]|uniref:lantibiotic immunity ABC transporter MutE/EpiE family permease subunit n=1 Tax=Clostridium sp. BJN0013 TaxID=3236840 RepID=UPI0034C5DFF4
MEAYFKSEYLKIKHTFMGKLIFLAPIFAIILSLILTPHYFEIDSYNWWYVMILPGMVSLLCTLIAVKDNKMKNMAVLSLPVDLKKVWISKILVCSLMIIFASIIHLFGCLFIGNILHFGKLGMIPAASVVLGSLVLIITFLWQIPFCLFLGSKIGIFPTILINIIAYFMLGVIFAVEDVLWIIPYAVPSRLMCPIIKVLPNGLPAVSGNQTFRPELLSDSVILPGIMITVVLFLTLTVLTAKWYERQEAK